MTAILILHLSLSIDVSVICGTSAATLWWRAKSQVMVDKNAVVLRL